MLLKSPISGKRTSFNEGSRLFFGVVGINDLEYI
jgi:hypothetical protein